jgi:carbonic anhydrase
VTASDELLQRNARRIRTTAARPLPAKPALRVAVVTCMDCRIDLNHTLGLKPGEAHVIRNAGGAITDDVIRSLAVSQRKLGTHEVLLMHHTRCGMATFTEAEFKDELEHATGLRPTWSVETFTDTKHEVRQSIRRVQQSPFLTKTTSVRGFVHDIETGTLTEVV